jgi:large subunit ribosomal protein L23
MKHHTTIIQSLQTEKSSDQQGRKQYTFMVRRNATKIEVKQAVKEIYGVEVKDVKTIVVPKKTRMLKGKYEWAKRPVFKKAIVTLKDNKTIDPNKI